MRLEGIGLLKNAITSSELEPATFRLVAQYLNQLRYRVPPDINLLTNKIDFVSTK
jgi:hypothetical protein